MSTQSQAEPVYGKKALSGLSLAQLMDFVACLGLPDFRARQIHSWIYAHQASTFRQMTSLSAALRSQLAETASVPLIRLAHLKVSRDGTRKYLFSLPDGQMVESVLMSFQERDSLSACVSSQVGCAVGCTFCATGYMGFRRNLTAQEIVDQVMSIKRESGRAVTNVVYMGQGEPLLNVEAVIESLHILINSVGIGARHLTVSTSGIIPGIERLARERLPVTLALSLHAPDQATRKRIVPLAEKYPVPELIEALKMYHSQTSRRVTIEYVLLSGLTDHPEQARLLAELAAPLHCNINLIPYNPTVGPGGELLLTRPALAAQRRFKRLAGSTGKTVTIRLTRGADIEAACGQLHNALSSRAGGCQGLTARNQPINRSHLPSPP